MTTRAGSRGNSSHPRAAYPDTLSAHAAPFVLSFHSSVIYQQTRRPIPAVVRPAP
ncbi:hypothetical protein [Streptomyces acidicola]|uniref:hypothetical protein n=1 Tax=Streptomyces acidicola TaxID=2596892 RepID=UPI003417BF12